MREGARERWILGAILAAGVALRVLQLATSLGTPDALFWSQHVRTIQRGGVFGSYPLDPSLNHPPLSIAIAHGVDVLGSRLGLEFVDAFRLLQTLADLITALLLARVGRTYAAAWFMLSPAAIFITGFHCQSDPLMMMFVVAAVVAAMEQRGATAGVAIACAAGIKVIALVALPLLLLAFGGRSLLRFILGAAAVFAAMFVPATIVSHAAVWKNLFLYTGPLTAWGWIFLFGRRIRIAVIAMLLLSLASLWVAEAWRRKRLAEDPARIARVVGAAFCLVLFFAPGFGVQYLFWPLPFLALITDRRVALAAHGVVSTWLFAVYTAWSGGWPWWFGNQRASLPLIRAGLAVWLTIGLVALLAILGLVRRRYSSSSSPSTPALLYFLVLL